MTVGASAAPANAGAAAAAMGARLDDVLFALYLAALALVPLFFGSNRLLAWGLNAVAFGGLAAAYEAGLLLSGRSRPVALRRITVPAALFAVLIGWILVQGAQWTPADWHNPLWPLARDALAGAGLEVSGSISVTPDESVIGAMRLATIAAAFWLALQLCRDHRRCVLLLRAVAAIGAGYAVFGLVQFAGWPDHVLWEEKRAYAASLTATFINRNSYATYAGLGLVACLALILESHRPAGERMQTASTPERALRAGMARLAALFVITAALLLTGSRAGIVSSACGVAVFAVLAAAMRRGWTSTASLLVPALLVGFAAFAVLGERFAERLAAGGGLDDRIAVAARVWDAATDVPWTGFGYGSFDLVFPIYREVGMGPPYQYWDKAHNTYVELIFELGFPASLAFAAMVAWIIAGIAVNSVRRRRAAMASLAALAASAGVLLHAFLDFSLQIQAVAITFWAMIGAGLARSWSGRADTSA